jgi:hypothetical protein
MKCTTGVLLALLTLLLAPTLHAQTGWSVNRYEGFRANITGGTNVTAGWTTGNLGNSWDEGEWVPYRLHLQNLNLANPNFSDIVVCYDFTTGNQSARFVDLVRGIQAGTSATGVDGWPQANGTAYPLTSVAQLNIAQNNQLEYAWTGYTLLSLPNTQVHRATGGGVGTASDAERCFIITRQDLLNAGFSGTVANLYIYFNLHLSQTFIWTLSLQSQLDAPPTDDWGGYLYSLPGFINDTRQGSGYVPGSSGHTYLTQGNRTVSIPIPPAPLGEISGLKWFDANNNGVRDNNEPVLEGWPIYISTIIGGIPVSYTELTDNAGTYGLSGLPQAVYTVSEEYQGPTTGTNYPVAAFTQTPPSTWDQSYPMLNSTVGVATGIATSAPGLALGYAPQSWSVDLSGTTSVQGNVNFGNFVPAPECEVTPAATTACVGEQVTFTAARIAQGTPPYTVSWTGPNNFSASTFAITITAGPNTAGTYTAVLTDANGLQSQGCSATLSLYPQPACAITGGPLAVCAWSTGHTYFAPLNNTPPVNIVGYSWQVTGNGTIVGPTTGQQVTVDATGDGSYTVILTTESTDGCFSTCSTTVTVNALPSCIITNTDPVCPGATTVHSGPANMSGYVWTISGNGTINGSTTSQNVSVTAGNTNNSNYTLTLLVTDGNNCSAMCNATVQVQDVTPPTMGCASDQTISCPAPTTLPFTPPTVADNCDPNPAVIIVGDVTTPGSCPQSYSVTRTWRATDLWGNTAECSQTVFVVDTQAPTINGTPTTPLTVECNAVPTAPTLTATDACDPNPTVTYNETRTNGPCLDTYTLTRTWTATDACGNTSIFVQTINVQDTTPPVMSGLPQTPITVQCDAVPAAATPTATDNCDTNVDIVYGEVRTNGPCLDTYTLTRTWTATDNCGNTQQFVQTINVQDTTPPVMSGLPQTPITVECSAVPNPPVVTATDNCDTNVDIVYGEVRTNGSCLDTYTLTRTWTATDNCGNTQQFVQTINVQDTTPPVMSGLPQTPITVECSAVPAAATPTATDNCDTNVDIVYGEVRTNGPCLDTYTLTRTWTATDNCGNTQQFVQTINVQDTTPPVMSGLPQTPITVECSAVPNPPTVTATDNCDTNVDIVYGEVRTNGPCLDTYTLTRTWTATDNCGNTQQFVQTINVQDTTPPVMSGLPQTPITVQCDAVPNPPVVTATDNCDTNVDLVYGEVRTNGPCVDTYTLTRTWTATDNCGNTQQFVQTINVQDTTPPVMSGLPQTPITVQCDAVPNPPTVTATDNCDTQVDIVYGEVRTNGPCLDTYTLTRTWTATDNCGNTQQFVQTINVQDTTPPVMSGLPQTPITVQCDAVPAAATPTATDNCDTNVDIVYGEVRTNGPCLDTYTLTRTWTATDNCGNTQQFVQTINVQDTTPPVMSGLPSTPITVQCDAVPNPPTVTATDNCDTNVDIVYGEVRTNGPCLDTYTLTRTWTATDNCGNTQQFVQTINVQDTTPPVMSGLPQTPITVECSAVPNPPVVTATDNCDTNVDIVYGEVRTNGPCLDTYTLTRTWTATDNCGNTQQFVQTINVQDTTPPVMSGLPQTPITVECSAVPNPATPTATDNCDTNVDITFNESRTNGPCLDTYTLTRTWTATDNCGNTQQFVQTINVQDTTPPVMSGLPQTPITVECSAVPPAATPTATDNCDTNVDIVYGEVRTNGPCLDTYTLTRTWTATDNCGNTQQFVQTINVQDTTPPVMSGLPQTPITVECDAVPSAATPTATDNCDTNVDIAYNESRTNGNCASNYTLTRTWTATDNCGNTQQFVQTINVQDTTPPAVTSASDETVECDGQGNQAALAAWLASNGGATATDNCGSVNWSNDFTGLSDLCGATGAATVTFTATDECGNTASTMATFTIEDTTPPTWDNIPANATIPCDQQVVFTTPTATDNCGTVTVNQVGQDVIVPGNCPQEYSVTRTWAAEDECGNTTGTVSQTITVVDDVPPVLTAAPDKDVLCASVWDFDDPTVTDNCDTNPTVTIVSTTTVVLSTGEKEHTRTWVATDACGNTSLEVSQVVTEGRCQYFTLTQGAYGNANGSWCGTGHPRRLALIQQLLASGPIVLGLPGQSLTITANDAQCVINKLPGAGPAATLPVGDAAFNNNCSTTIPYPLQGQRFRNGFLTQAITFALNLRLDPGLATFNLPAPSTPYMRTEDPDYINGICGDGDDVGLGTFVVNYIPPSVLTYLGSNGTNKTLADLLALANTALGGGSTGNVSLADISAALDAYNQGFDEGRFFAGYHSVPPPKSASTEVIPSDFQLFQNHPNPFNPSTTIEYSVPVNSTVHLAVYNSLGNLVAVLVDGEVREGRHSVTWNSRANGADLPSGIYTYRLIATAENGKQFSAVKTMMLVK